MVVGIDIAASVHGQRSHRLPERGHDGFLGRVHAVDEFRFDSAADAPHPHNAEPRALAIGW